MKFNRLFFFVTLFLFLALLLPSFLSTQDTIGSTYIGIKDIANIYSANLEYKYSRNEIIIRNEYNTVSINEDGYLGIKNGKDVFYLPSKIYHRDSVIYTPIEILNSLERTKEINEDFIWLENYDVNIKVCDIKSFKYIIIDPGHGGKDPGATNNKIYEKEIVLNVALKLRDELIKRNPDITIIMTRTTDKDLDPEKSKDLRKRAEIGSEYALNGNGLFISIHANAMPFKENYENTKGIETWYYYPTVKSDGSFETLDYRKTSIQKVYKDYFTPKDVDKNNLINQIDKQIINQSKKFATTIQDKLFKKVSKNTEDRGIKKAFFQVLRESVIPAVLCEIGFVTNSEEVKLLITDAYQSKIAEGLADGILEFISSEYPIVSKSN